MKKFIFDVDGTLTQSRKQMEEEFKDFFIPFAHKHKVYLVTGSDRKKTLQQLGNVIYNLCDRVYQCSGNDVWEKDENIKSSEIEIPCEMYEDFTRFLSDTNFNIRTGAHIEKRPGLINFSIIGRNCCNSDREKYVEYDRVFKEREEIVSRLRRKYKEKYSIQLGGQIGVDIMYVNKDKSQIIVDFSKYDDIHFFGDKMDIDGNDYTLAQEVLEKGGKCYHVKDWKETWNHLKKLSD